MVSERASEAATGFDERFIGAPELGTAQENLLAEPAVTRPCAPDGLDPLDPTRRAEAARRPGRSSDGAPSAATESGGRVVDAEVIPVGVTDPRGVERTHLRDAVDSAQRR
jgi:hypothetical protein